LWHVDPLLGGDREIGNTTEAVARQRHANNRTTVCSARSVPRYYKQDNWSDELVVGQSPAYKNVSTEAENIVRIRHQAMTDEETTDLEDLVRAVVNFRVCELALAL
jgi:hypothetical protein